jgi:hypothetical protein
MKKTPNFNKFNVNRVAFVFANFSKFNGKARNCRTMRNNTL